MEECKLSNYGTIFTQRDEVIELVKVILTVLEKQQSIIIDCSNVNIMTTTAAKSILKPIADKYGYANIFSKISFKGATEDLRLVIATAVDGLKEEC